MKLALTYYTRKTPRVTFRLTKNEHKLLVAGARHRGVSVNEYVRMAVSAMCTAVEVGP